MSFAIPEKHYKALELLLGLSENKRDEIEKALESAKPTLLPRDLASHISGKASLPLEDTREILGVLVSLYMAKYRTSLELGEFVTEICQSIKRVKKPDLKPPDDDWKKIESFLLKVLSMDSSLGATSKALDLMTSYERTFCHARIISDLRPIFTSDPTKEPVATVIVHGLEVAYHPAEEVERLEKLFVAMDLRDLRKLKEVIDRAISKHESIQNLCKRSNILCLEEKK